MPVALSKALLRVPGGLVAAALGYGLSVVVYRTAFPASEDCTVVRWILDLGVTVLVGGLDGYLGAVVRWQ